MRRGAANIRSPEVLKRFRKRFYDFDEKVRAALELITRDLSRVVEWIHREQLPHWRRRLRQREEEEKLARRKYLESRYRDHRTGKASNVDERKAFERARNLHVQAQRKLKVVEQWMATIEHKASKITPPLKRLEALLDHITPRALGRLDHMMDRLEDYLSAAASHPATDGSAAREKTDADDQPGGADAERGSERAGG